jgi:hypothetical protein
MLKKRMWLKDISAASQCEEIRGRNRAAKITK